ncbi:hypothetical protein [Paenibacillus hamazuiensis]|uniref:hypothetical protein n=1 Tax=Paenibacillus hamazuiensis TaxID=2936508 RepID=UPI0020100C8E|nr:hypothetical protein [Paenibacillus hamazuiensis]
MKKVWSLWLALSLFSLMFASAAFGEKAGGGGGGKAGTTLNASVTAEGYRVKKMTYDWSIAKSVNIERPVVERSKPFTLAYTLKATRTLISETEQTGVRGVVTVTNGGAKPTENLKIVAFLENVPGASATVIPSEPLAPGQTKSYPVSMVFAGSSSSSYKLVAQVTITNHSGSLGIPKGPTPKQGGIKIPASAMIESVDASAVINDAAVCPTGFTCTPNKPATWTLNQSGDISYSMTVTNSSAPAKSLFALVNTARLTENTSGEQRSASKTVLIFTGCGCTGP